jgi:uroporphyrinogen decarboxylase
MTDRERFIATMHFRPRDRAPICDFGFWPETISVWHAQGLPEHITFGYSDRYANEFFGMDLWSGGPYVSCDLVPQFDTRVIEDRGDHEVVQQPDGVTVLRRKFMSSIPMHESHLLVGRESWRRHYKPRLDPAHPLRWERFDEKVKEWLDPQRTAPATIVGGSLFGRLRDWMGIENISMLIYDDPALFEEMVTTMADLAVGVMQRLLATGAIFDACSMWEDMCYRGGPLISPSHFRQYLVPQYKRITSLLRKHGVDVVYVDCDGKIDALIPLWLEAGVNCMFPVEVGTWHADPLQLRAEFGKDLLMMGGFDKHILQGTPRQIENEVQRLTPLVEEGGYIGFADHRVPPDVPLENYLFYLKAVRRLWGRGVNLKPLGLPSRSRRPPGRDRPIAASNGTN